MIRAINGSTPCGTHHFASGSLHAPYKLRGILSGRHSSASRNATKGVPYRRAIGRVSRLAFTLLEVLLALALAVVILALVGLSVHLHLAVAAKSRDQVMEAQLARNLLQEIADDLRNAVPFQPPPSSSSSGNSGQSGASGGTASSSGTSATSSTAPLSGGIYGTAQAIQIETARRPRAMLASLQTASDPSQPARLSDLRVVTYSLGAPCTVDLSQTSPPAASGSGLYRHEQDRAMFFYGSQNGQADNPDPAKDLLAPEVVDFHIDYFGGSTGTTSTSGSGATSTSGSASTGSVATSGGTTNADSTANGTTSDDQWDSTQQSMLPAAVRISISLRHDAAKSLLGLLENDKRPPVTYSLFVYLPNAAVDAVGQASQQAIQAPASSMFVSIMPQGGGGGNGGAGGRFGGPPGRGFGENGGGRGGRGQGGQGGRGRGGEAGNGGERGGGEGGGGERGGNGGRGGRGRGGEGGGRQGEQGGRGRSGEGGGRGQGGQGGFGQGGKSSQGGG